MQGVRKPGYACFLSGIFYTVLQLCANGTHGIKQITQGTVDHVELLGMAQCEHVNYQPTAEETKKVFLIVRLYQNQQVGIETNKFESLRKSCIDSET